MINKIFCQFTIFVFSLFLSLQKASALQIYLTGSAEDAVTHSRQLICLGGGDEDDHWAAGWKALLESTAGGDVVIIRTDGERGGYESWIYNDEAHHHFPQVNSVRTIVIENARDANRIEVQQIILKAEFVFFAGGDQARYINWFRNSKLADAIKYVMNIKKISVAGTSAGTALLGGIDFKAEFSSPSPDHDLVTAEDVMSNPTGDFIDLDRTTITASLLQNMILDTHFTKRGRQGRLMGFMARAIYNKYENIDYSTIKGVGIDEGTAVCYNQVGRTKVFGVGDAYFVKPLSQVERIQPNKSLNWYSQKKAVETYVIHGSESPSAEFNLINWSGSGGQTQYWWIDGNNFNPPHFGVD